MELTHSPHRSIAARTGLVPVCAFVALTPFLGAPVGPERVPKRSNVQGVVVEDLDPDSPLGRAGVRAGDILIRWERAANSPANPSAARGDLRSPVDLEDLSVEQMDRGRITLFTSRDGVQRSFEIPKGRWDVFDALAPGAGADIYVHPQMPPYELEAFRAGLDSVGKNEIEAGTKAWNALGREIAVRGTDPDLATFLWLRAGTTLVNAKKVAEGHAMLDQALAVASDRQMIIALKVIWSAKATAYWRAGDRAKSEDAFQQVIRLSSGQASESVWTNRSLRGIALLQGSAGEPAARLVTLNRAVDIARRTVPGSVTLARTLTGSSDALLDLGDTAAAVRDGREALAIADKLLPEGNLLPYLITLDNALAERGDLAGAEALLRRALAVSPHDTLDEAFAAGNLGVVALRRGDLSEAERLFKRNLVIVEKQQPGGRREVTCLINLGDLNDTRGDFEPATRYYERALAIQEKLTPGGPVVARILTGLGFAAFHRGDLEGARSYQSRALEIQQKLTPGGLQAALSFSALGEIAVAAGDPKQAESLYRQSLDIRERLAPGSRYEAETLHDLGSLARQGGRWPQAADLYRRSIDALNTQKSKLGGTQEGRSRFAASYADFYRDYVDVLIHLGREQDAFEILEHSRARALLAMLATRDLALTDDVPEELLKARNSTAASYDATFDEIRNLSPRENPKDVDDALARLNALRIKQEEIADQIRRTSPRFASLKDPQPLNYPGARADLDPGTLVLAYSVGQERAFLFAVEPRAARRGGLAVYDLGVKDKSLRDAVETYRNLLESPNLAPPDSGRALMERARSLYNTLIKPAEPLISKYDRILVLPDGPLHTLPWAALVRAVKNDEPQYFVEWKPIHIAVSATVYAELKRGRRDNQRDASVLVAAFGDPKYPKLPEKKVAVKRGDGDEPSPDPLADEYVNFVDPQLHSVVRSGFRLEPLPASRTEVEQIASLYSPRSVAYLGPEATEEKAKAIGKEIPLVHFATHAIINERFPLDSALVLTIPEHPKEGQDNGLLQAWEIFEQVRIDADLVTLSACDSGLGKEMGGEGLIGLVRAFQYAGARSVLASLWKVEDKATAELMRRFYTYVKSGKTKDEALRSAQIDLIHSKEYSNPRDWAAFQLNGDWK